jgi:hypothetical protein
VLERVDDQAEADHHRRDDDPDPEVLEIAEERTDDQERAGEQQPTGHQRRGEADVAPERGGADLQGKPDGSLHGQECTCPSAIF